MAKNLNRVLAILTATTMVLGSSVTAFATSGVEVSLSGSGTEVGAKTDVYTVTVPTGDALTKLLNFNVDPQGLVAESGNAFGAAVTVNDNNGVLFKNTNGDKVSVSDTSDAIEIVNKSYKPVQLSITAKVDAGSYAAGLSTTSDFSGTSDASKGLYFGLISTGEVERALNTTGFTAAARIQSDASEYELKATNAAGATTYEYALKDSTNAKGVTYSIKVVAALNRALPLTTWQTIDSGTGAVTAAAMPSLSIKFTPTQNKYTIGQAKWNSSWAIQFALPGATAENGGMTTAPTAVKWNGKDIAGDITVKDGWAVISWGQLITAYNTAAGTSFTNSKYEDVIWNETNVVEWTFGGASYIADVK